MSKDLRLIYDLEKDMLKVIQGRMSKMFFAKKWKENVVRPYETICEFEQAVQGAFYEAEKNVR